MQENPMQADSFSSYIGHINSIYDGLRKENPKLGDRMKGLFFRGHSQTGFKLLPSVFREDDSRKSKSERQCLLNYRDNMPRHSAPYDFIRQRTEILADMQHFGIKTRLMDWSFSPLVALYFALEGCNKGKGGVEEDSEVWVLNPWAFHEKFFPKVGDREALPHDVHVLARALLSSYSYEEVKRIIHAEFYGCILEEVDLRLPFPFVAKYGNPRLIHQAGAFTIHGGIQGESAAHTPLDQFDEVKSDPRLTNRIVIPKDKREVVLDDLSRLFINEYTVFPDLEGMSRHLKSYDSLYSVRRKKKQD